MVVSAHVAALLEARLPLHELRLSVRGKNAELDDTLLALHTAAMLYVDAVRADLASEAGSGVPPPPEVGPSSLSVSQVAAQVGVDGRTVRLAASAGRLCGVKDADGRWRFVTDDIVAWAAAREQRSCA